MSLNAHNEHNKFEIQLFPTLRPPNPLEGYELQSFFVFYINNNENRVLKDVKH